MTLRKTLRRFLNTMIAINNKEYSYYQSYHDIGLYFLMLYIKDFETGISVFQRFSEFFLKQNLKEIGFDFLNVNEIFIDIFRNLNKEGYELVEQCCDARGDFVVSWILSLYTHNLTDDNVQFRLFDFFITHHPLSVYYLTVNICIDEIPKIKTKDNEELVICILTERLWNISSFIFKS